MGDSTKDIGKKATVAETPDEDPRDSEDHLDAEQVIAGSARPFGIEIADAARFGGSHEFERTYKLTKTVGGVVSGQPTIEVYGRNDQCFITGDEFPHTAYDINQFDVHGLVRDLLDSTAYVLTYYDEDKLSDSQAETVGVERDE